MLVVGNHDILFLYYHYHVVLRISALPAGCAPNSYVALVVLPWCYYVANTNFDSCYPSYYSYFLVIFRHQCIVWLAGRWWQLFLAGRHHRQPASAW